MLVKIKDKSEDLLVKTEYYSYLKDLKPSDIHKISTKVGFLKSKYGFTIGVDRISSEDSFTLNAIEETYFRLEIVPTLNKNNI